MQPDPGWSTLRKHNRLLASVTPDVWSRLAELFRADQLELGHTLDSDRVWFPVEGIISVLASVEDGHAVEVGLVGTEGVAGLPGLLNGAGQHWEYLVQMDGEALSVALSDIRGALSEAPLLQARLIRYAGGMLAVVSQGVACNRFHPIEQRLARWLLMMLDRAESRSFAITHEFISLMVGAQRPSISVAISDLSDRGVIRMRRGSVEVRDRGGLEAAACGCYFSMRDNLASAMKG